MKYLVRIKELCSARSNVRFAAAAVAVAAVFAGVVAGRADAAPAVKAGKASYRQAKDSIRAPKLVNGVLTVAGTQEADTIVLRLQAGQPGTLQVDFDNGSAVFSVPRAADHEDRRQRAWRRRRCPHRREQRRVHQ